MNNLKLNMNIYDYNTLNKTALAFRTIAQVYISVEGSYYVCTFNKLTYDAKTTMAEFENYAIDLINQRGNI